MKNKKKNKILYLIFILLVTNTIFFIKEYIFNDSSRVEIGFPFKIYESFQVNENPFRNSGWYPKNFILNNSVYLICILIVNVFFYKSKSD